MKYEQVSKLEHWIPKRCRKSRGRPTLTYIDIQMQNTGLEVEELNTAMQDRNTWFDNITVVVVVVIYGQHND